MEHMVPLYRFEDSQYHPVEVTMMQVEVR